MAITGQQAVKALKEFFYKKTGFNPSDEDALEILRVLDKAYEEGEFKILK